MCVVEQTLRASKRESIMDADNGDDDDDNRHIEQQRKKNKKKKKWKKSDKNT